MNQEKKYHYSKWVLMILILFFLYIIYLGTYPFKTLEVNTPFKVHNSPVEKGKALIFEMDYCKYTDKSAVISRKLANEVVFSLPDVRTHALIGCRKVNVSSVVIPKFVPDGKYTLIQTAHYKINLFRDIYVRYETEEFEIIGG